MGMIVLLVECNAIIMNWGTQFTTAIADTSGKTQRIPPNTVTTGDSRILVQCGG